MLPNWLYGKSLKKLQEILNSGGQTAAGVSYSNTESGLEATNAQAAIDEVVEELDTKAAQSVVANINTQMSYINPFAITMNIYMTSDAIPTFGSFTNQDATDIAQAMYDLYKKLDGNPSIRFGRLSYRWLKKSDGTQLGSGEGSAEIINIGPSYNSCLLDNSRTRMRISLKDYGYCVTTDYALWGSAFTYSRRGTDTDGTVVDQHQKETVGTISTYIG